MSSESTTWTQYTYDLEALYHQTIHFQNHFYDQYGPVLVSVERLDDGSNNCILNDSPVYEKSDYTVNTETFKVGDPSYPNPNSMMVKATYLGVSVVHW